MITPHEKLMNEEAMLRDFFVTMPSEREKQRHHPHSPRTAALTWRVLICCAASYCIHLETSDPLLLRMQANLHHVGDVRAWAKRQIRKILDDAHGLVCQFNHDSSLRTSALSAAAPHAARLERVGFRCWNVPGADGMRTKGDSNGYKTLSGD